MFARRQRVLATAVVMLLVVAAGMGWWASHPGTATRASSDIPTVMAPDGWLEKLLSVLLDNACRYTPAGGTVTVTVSGAAGHVGFSVGGSGPGVPARERQRIFDRFHRGATGHGGTGLGLAIAAAVVRRTRGNLEVLDAPRGGALFAASWHT